ncbi:MAG: hypothetical protein ACOZF2_15045 [Thermodesulfobacteriota bacterium]
MKKPLLIAAVLLSLGLPGASWAGEPATIYYPLKEGMTWVYSVVSTRPGAQKITITSLVPRKLQDQTVYPRKWDFGGGVKYYFIAKDDIGIYRYGEQTGENGEPRIIKPKVYYLKDPVDVGTYWDIATKMGADKLKVEITIEGIRETVQVPAGKYEDCVLLKHVGKAQAKKGGAGLSLTAYEWYAPKVGLVKSMFTIDKGPKSKGETKESTTYQLESFKP